MYTYFHHCSIIKPTNTIGVLIEVETSSQLFLSSSDAQYSILIFTVKVELDQEIASLPIAIEWTTHNLRSSMKIERLSVCTVTGVSGSCVVNITDTQEEIYYRCLASHWSYSDTFVDEYAGI